MEITPNCVIGFPQKIEGQPMAALKDLRSIQKKLHPCDECTRLRREYKAATAQQKSVENLLRRASALQELYRMAQLRTLLDTMSRKVETARAALEEHVATHG